MRVMVMLLLAGSLSPAFAGDAFATPGDVAGQQDVVAQDGTSSLEFDVLRCPADYNPDDAFGTCTEFGVPGVSIQVTSVDPAAGVDATLTTEQQGGTGPGRVALENLVAGDYTVVVGLPPEDGVRYSIYCGVAGGGAPLPPSPTDALQTVVSIPDATAVACDLYIVPDAPATGSTLSLSAFTCPAGTMQDANQRDFENFQASCSEPAASVDFTLRTSDSTTTTQPTDNDGQTEFTFASGSPVEFWADVELEEDETLFCSTEGAQPGVVEMDERGIATIQNAGATGLTCSWFLVEQAEATEEPEATQEPTEEPEATQEPTEEPEATMEPTQETAGDSSLDLFAFTCAFDAVNDPGSAGFADFQAACTDEAPGVKFVLRTGDDSQSQSTDGNGQTSFTFAAGDTVDFWADVPLESDEHLFCSLNDGDAETINLDDQGVAHFDNSSPEARTCSWFLVDDAPEPTAEPTESPTEVPVEPTEEPDGDAGRPGGSLASISVSPSVCPIDYTDDPASVSYDDLAADCTIPLENVSFTLELPAGGSNTRVSNGVDPVAFPDLQPGFHALYSSVPLEAASERLFCVADGGNRYEKEFDSRGVTAFAELETESIECEWFVIPTNLRGDETGGSLEIHLSACPVGYEGDPIFDDCHGNGLDDYEFTVVGDGGSFTGSTNVTQTPGPGVVNFTGLPAGEYTVQGGPPGDFGRVSLFCSIQSGDGDAEYSIDGVTATVAIGENQHVLCDWYFIPEDGSGTTPTPTPTEEPSRAEILVTLFACPAASNGTYGGATLDSLEDDCTEKVNDVTFRLANADSAPLTAKTGASGEGAVRFFDLLPGDLTMKPSLPSDLTSVAVFCMIEDGDPYQKALSNGATTFVNVDGESITCSWFAVKDRTEPAPSPTGSITIREYQCNKDRSEIVDWEKECTPEGSGASFTLTLATTAVTSTGTPNDQGVHVFTGLANGHYSLVQDQGAWCRAVADRVDDKSRVIVQGGGNTDVVIYQCGPLEGLPVTGTGPASEFIPVARKPLALGLGLLTIPLVVLGFAPHRRPEPVLSLTARESTGFPVDPETGRSVMRFR